MTDRPEQHRDTVGVPRRMAAGGNGMRLLGALACALVFAGASPAAVAADQPKKIIIDTDFNVMSDDGQVGVMAAQLQAQGVVKIMGITVVSGNQWLKQGVADALKAVERMGIAGQVGVYAGANRPLSHDYKTIQDELASGAGGDGYLGAWQTPEPQSDADLKAPPDGFAVSTRVEPKSAVDFIANTVKANPHEVTIVAIGPATNLAEATAHHPEIVPLIKEIIYMGGAVHVPGNTTKTAEFNWWFDPEAARAVLHLPVPQVVVPLDVTDTVLLTKPIYDRIAHAEKQTAVTTLYRELTGYGFSGKNGFENNPNYTQNVWDTLTIAYLVDPSFATKASDEYVDVVTTAGLDDGRSIGYGDTPPPGKFPQKVKFITGFDNPRFFDFYVDLLTRPVPVVPANH